MINRLYLLPMVLILFFGLIFAALLTPFITDYQQLRELDIPKDNDLAVLWNIKLQGKIISSPQTTDGIIYVQTSSEIVAIDQSKSEIIWRQKIDGDDSNCAFVINEDMIFAPSDHGALYAINREDGQIIWSLPRLQNKEKFEDIKVQNGFLYFATYNRYLEVHKIENGELVWRLQSPQRSLIKLKIIDKTLLMSASKKLFAFDALNGDQLWERSLDIGEYFYWKEKDSLIIYEWRYGAYWITGIDIISGLDQWKTETAMSEVNCFMIVGDQLLVSGDGIARFDWESKKIIWTNKTLNHLSCPVLMNDTIAIRKMSRDLYFYDYSSGDLLSRYPLRWSVFIIPSRVKEPLLLGNQLVLSITGREISILFNNN